MKQLKKNLVIFFIVCFIIQPFGKVVASLDELDSRPVVLFIPGLMGTELYEDEGKTDLVWFDYFETRKLEYGTNLEPGLPLGWPGSKNYENVPEWLEKKLDLPSLFNYYGPIADYFNQKNDQYRLYYFSYDWRAPNKVNAERLKDRINSILTTVQTDKINIIAHSNGGLIAKKYILDTQGQKVKKFISVGTPYFGAPLALQMIDEGFYHNDFIELVKQDIIVDTPVVYDLLPSGNYFKTNGNASYLYDEKEKRAMTFEEAKAFVNDNYNKELYQGGLEFQEDMYESVDQYVDFYRIIGDGRSTIGGFRLKKGWFSFSLIPEEVNGDAIVPLAGSAYGKTDVQKDNIWYTDLNRHEYLFYETKLMNGIHHILQGEISKIDLRTDYKRLNKKKITLYSISNSGSLAEPMTLNTSSKNSVKIAAVSENEERFMPNIELTLSNGKRLVVHDGEFIQKPEDIQVRAFQDLFEIIVDPVDLDLKVSSQNHLDQNVGMYLFRYENDLQTGIREFQNIDLTQGSAVFSYGSDIDSAHAGLDTNGDGVADIEIKDTVSSPNDNPGEDNPNADIQIEITGTAEKNQWFTDEVTIFLSTTLEAPIDEEEDAINDGLDNGNESGGSSDSEPQEPAPPTIRYNIDGGGESKYETSIKFGEDGKHSINVIISDDKGNVLGQATKTFKIDQTKPDLDTQIAAVHGENGWLVSDAEISIGAMDETSKLARVDYNYNSRGQRTYENPFKETAEGTHTIYAEAEDNAGLIESLQSIFKIDKTKPVISDVYLQDEYYWDQEFPIEFNVNDNISGVATVQATINGKEVQNGSTYRFTEPGWHTYRIDVKDVAGWKAMYETEFEVYIPAKIRFAPEHLQLDHGQGMATNFIELPEPFAPENMNFATIQTNSNIVHIQDSQYGFVKNPIGDEDENGILDMMLKYERESLVPVIAPDEGGPYPIDDLNGEPEWSPTTLTMFGDWGEYHFKGYEYFTVSNKRYTPPPPDVTPPGITMDPEDGTTNVSINLTPVLSFSEPVIQKNGAELDDQSAKEFIRFKNVSGEPVPFTANWMKNTLSIQVNPSIQLEGSTRYIVEIQSDAVTDLSGNGNEHFKSSFTTEYHQIIIDSPLPLPIIEAETSTVEEPQDQPPVVDRTPNTNTKKTVQKTEPVYLGDDINVYGQEEFEKLLEEGESTGKVTLSVSDKNQKLALSSEQLNELSTASLSLEAKISDVTFQIKPDALKQNDDSVSHIVLGAEIVDEEEQQDISENATNRARVIFVGEDMYHLSVSAIKEDEREEAIQQFNDQIRVTIPIPDAAQDAVSRAELFVGRFNEITNQWDLVSGEYDKESGTFLFETDKFSYWTLMIYNKSFMDIKGHWAQEDIEYMASHGYIKGLNNEEFGTNSMITRAQFATILVNILELEEESNLPFEDISQTAWYYDDVNKAYTAGLIKGVTQDRFAPEDLVTREQMAVMVANALQYRGIEISTEKVNLSEKFVDNTEISAWAIESAGIVAQSGIIKGKIIEQETRFAPKDKATRAEAVVMLKTFLDEIRTQN
jgi:pimeloyl-ACP methyl ester carboxylesterase